MLDSTASLAVRATAREDDLRRRQTFGTGVGRSCAGVASTDGGGMGRCDSGAWLGREARLRGGGGARQRGS